jgi:hypothetical protein
MSIVQSLKRLFRPAEYYEERMELRRKAETRESEGQPDGPPAKILRCRLCGYEGEAKFCLRCLAETMDAVKK